MPYYYERYSRKKIIPLIFLLCLVSAIIGGIISLKLAPLVYGSQYYTEEQSELPFSSGNKVSLSSGALDYSPVVDIAEHVGPQ